MTRATHRLIAVEPWHGLHGSPRRSEPTSLPQPLPFTDRPTRSAWWHAGHAPLFAVSALVIALVNVAVLGLKLPGILNVLYLNSDTASAPVITSLAGPGSTVTLGNYPWYESLWFLKATSHLPGHLVIWTAAPIVCTVVAYALLLSVLARLFDRTSVLVVGALLACITPFQQSVLFTLDTHGPLVLHACVLLAALVWLIERPNRGIASLLVIGICLVVFTAAGAASDPLTYPAAVIPFTVGALVASRSVHGRARTSLVAFGLLVSISAALIGEVTAAAMRERGWSGVPLRLTFVLGDKIVTNLSVFATAFANLGGGNFFGTAIHGGAYLTFLAGMLTFAAFAVVVRWLLHAVSDLVVRPDGVVIGDVRVNAYGAFWAAALIGTSAAFLLTSAPQDSHSARYLFVGYLAVIALLPLAARSSARSRVLLAGGALVFVALSLFATVREPVAATSAVAPVGGQVSVQIEQFVRSQGATVGYADYWDAASLTWATRFGVHAYPAINCGAAGARLCAYPLNVSSAWYDFGASRPVFVLVDPVQPGSLVPPTSAGTPTATAKFGTITVDVYANGLSANNSCSAGKTCTVSF